MKIGLVCPYNIFKGGGVQECVLALQKELSRRGHQVHIITPTPRDHPAKVPESIILLGTAANVKSFHTTAQVSASVNTDLVDAALEKYDFDILHFHEPWVPILSRQILTRSRSKNIATFHAKLPDTVMSRTIERVITPYTRSILKYLDGLTAVSDAGAEFVHSLTDKPVKIIANGIDLKYYHPDKSIEEHPKTIVYVGRLEKRKGVKYLLNAYWLLLQTRPDVRLIIAGDGVDRQKLEDTVANWPSGQVEFLGFVSDKQKLQLIQQADVFCSPARYGESFGIVLLEAMACGTPTVAGDNPGYQSVLKDEGASSIVNTKDSDAFAAKLDQFLYDDKLRQAWSSWALSYVKQFSYTNIVDQYESLYKQLGS
ncbi:MAG TPA: glycosyltransferase family 4 protein [Candidatus Saccharimonadales bacterium]|nr:glycosyltransferase family 4 protein [Candidatus Saccharimonadales bacterium]